jgi:hypothetical protein
MIDAHMPRICSKRTVGILVAVAALGGVVFAAWRVMNRERPKASPAGEIRTDLARDAEFSASSTADEIDAELETAYRAGRLEELWSAEIPNGGRLVLAAPTSGGRPGNGSCARSDRFCGMFVDRNGSKKILMRGARLTGFKGLDRFIDENHAMIVSGYTLYDYTILGRYALNLENGEFTPRLIVEIDADDHSALLTASGYGNVIVLDIQGKRESGRIVPTSVRVRSEDGTNVYQEIGEADVVRIAGRSAASEQGLAAIAFEPTVRDAEALRLNVKLFGEPFVLDLNTKTLEATMSAN